MPHIQSDSRDTIILFPPSLDEYVTEDNPVRFIEAFVDQLELEALGFQRVVAAVEGRPGYHPADLLKLYIYGYLNRIRSSRALERETQRNVEVMWLLKKLTPDHKTIADFRKDQSEARRQVCREFTQLCKELELFGGELVAIDGSKFLAVNSRKRNFTAAKLEKLLKELDEHINAYWQELDEQDIQGEGIQPLTTKQLHEKLEQLQTRKTQYEDIQTTLLESGESQISLTDPDSRSRHVRQGSEVCYNVQTVVDAKYKLIVEHEVTNKVTDQTQLAPMAKRAKETLGIETLDAVTDRGYYDGSQIKQCLEAGITPYVPKPITSVNQNRGRYIKPDFIYDVERDIYCCPQGQPLEFRFATVELGRHIRYYKTAACRACPAQDLCTTNKEGRRITRWVDEHLLEEMAQRIQDHPEITRQRKEIVEHPFGTLKRGMNQGYFLCRGCPG